MVPPQTDSTADILNSFDVIRAEIRAAMSSASTAPGNSRPKLVMDVDQSLHTAARADAESRFADSVEQLQRLQEKCDAAGRQLEESNVSQQALTARLRHSLEQQAQAHQDVESLRQQLADSQRNAAFLTERNTRLTKDYNALTAMHAGWKDWLDRLEGQAADMERSVSALRSENERLSRELAALSGVEQELRRRSEELAVAQRCAQEADARATAMAKARDEFGTAAQLALKSITDGQQFVESLADYRHSMEEALARETARCAELTHLVLQATKEEASRQWSQVDAGGSHDDVVTAAQPHLALLAPDVPPFSGTQSPCSSSLGPAEPLQRIALLEGRVVDLTLKLNLSEEVKEAALLELQQLKGLLVAPLADVIREEDRQVRAPLVDRWDELQALWGSFSAWMQPSSSKDAGGSAGLPSEVVHFHSPMSDWHRSVEEISENIAAQSACIEALRSENAALRMSRQQQQQHSLPQQGQTSPTHRQKNRNTAAAAAVAVENIPVDASTSASLGSRSCSICGWAVQEGSAAMCVCRICGDCYHRQCCHQSESRFICHKHEKAVGKPVKRLR